MLRGVNLGGWLIVESLTTPDIFEGVFTKDETSLLLDKGPGRLQKHHENYFSEADFKWLAERGINALRIPVPYWIFGDVKPYIGSIKQLDWAMDMAKKYDLQVILDLHAAPGSQNGQDHSGKSGKVGWAEPGNITLTVEVLEKLALRYGKYPNLWGVELLNEPSPKLSLSVLQDFYVLAYEKLRAVCSPDVRVVMHDAFRPMEWQKFFETNEFENVILDLHLYHVFDQEDKKLDIHKQLKKVLKRRDILAEIQQYVPVVIGEWSLGLNKAAFRGLDAYEADKARQAFGTLQLNAYQKTSGWFFWTYKTQDAGGWNFRYCVERGWLPPSFELPVTVEVPA